MVFIAKRVWAALVVACVVLIGVASPSFAAVYGAGSYDKCSYNCPTSATTKTTFSLASGLTVTINLANGQTVPYNGYVVIVQPASGQTGTLKEAGFYVNDAFQFTGTPNSTGAIRWLWQPTQTSGSVRVKIVITDSSSNTTTQEFTVTIGEKAAPPPSSTTNQQKDTGVVGAVTGAVLGFVANLPVPVIYGLPYFLFGLLLVNIVLLITQTQRELREISVLQNIIRLERNVGIEKNAFVSLASHYLRTPISIIEGGFDLLRQQAMVPSDVGEQARQLTANLRTKVNALLARSEDTADTEIQAAPEKLPSVWKNAGLYLPIVLIGVFVLAFNYLVAHIEALNINQLNFIVQAVAFALLAIVFYQVFRRLQLRRRDTLGMRQALKHEQDVNQTRDQLIVESSSLLSGDIEALRTLTSSLPDSNPATYIRDGVRRFRNVLVKFSIASQLKGGHSSDPFTQTSLADMLRAMPGSLNDAATQKGVQLNLEHDEPLAVRGPQLVTYVLASLLANAIEYSPEHSQIDVASQQQNDAVTITVTDHGPGISPEKLSFLFRPFAQTQDVERFTHEGMGFSLYLDKLILTYLGGDIALQSKPNVATTATIRLPLTASPA